VVGITSSVHLLHAYAEEHGAGAEAGAAAWRATRRLRWPIGLSLLTTSAAFLTLGTTGVPAFRSGGLIVGLGVLAAIPVVLLGLPAALAWVRPRPRGTVAGRLDRPLLRVAAMVVARRWPVFLGGLLITAAGSALAARARVKVDVLQAFKPESRVARTYRFLDERLTATLYVDLILKASPQARIAEVLADLDAFSDKALALPGIDNALSLSSLVRYGASILGMGPEVLSGGAGLEAILLVLRGPFASVTGRFEDAPERRYRMKLRVREGTDPSVLDALRAAASELRTGEGTLTGLYVRAAGTARHVVRNLAASSALMTAIVVVTAALALRSWRAGWAALLPNLLPPAAVFGFESVRGAALDVSAIAVASVAIGMTIDNTLHALFRLRAERAAGRSLRGAILRTQRSVGRAMVMSTAVLVAGLAFLSGSAFLPTAHFGVYTAAACVVGLLGDLLLLPAAVAAFRCL
ncbi:MAG: hypothetical protein ACREID_10395, partial [Planctomycetota bacterium]